MKNFFFIIVATILTIAKANAALVLTESKNGNIIFEQDKKAMISTVQFVVQTGSLADPVGKEGLTRISFLSLLRGTNSLSRNAFNEQVERLGAQMDIDIGTTRTIVSLDVVSDNIQPAVNLMSDAILHPGLRAEDIKSLLDEEMAKLEQEKSNNRAMLKRTIRQAMYSDTPLAFPPEGTIDGLKNITKEDIQSFLATYLKSENIVIGVSTNHDKKQTFRFLADAFASLPEGKKPTASSLQIKNPVGRHLYLVNREGSSTTEMGIVQLGLAANDTRVDSIDLANFIFGGDFTSRLMTVLRKENGWTYGAYSGMGILEKPRAFGSTYVMYAFPQAQFTSKALAKTLDMYEAYVKTGITQKELVFGQRSLANSHPFSSATAKTRLANRMYARLDGAPNPSDQEYRKNIYGLTRGSILKSIKSIHDPQNLVIVLVGAPEKLQEAAKEIKNLKSTTVVEDPMKKIN